MKSDPMTKRHVTITVVLPVLFSLILLTASCAVNPVTGRQELMLLSEANEVKLGHRTDAQVIQEYGIYDDSNFTGYINDLGRRIGQLSHRPNLSYHIKILDSPVVNAFAVPGGYLYFTRGILANLNSEAELVGVLGHELGHITARHSAQQYSRAQLAQIGMGVGMVFSETFRGFGELAQFGVGMLFLKFSRDNERQSDDLGVEYSTRAGYDADHMANFFETLERLHQGSDRSGLPGWFSTHPNPEDRIEAVRRKAGEWRQNLGVRNLKVNRNSYLKKIDGLVFGEDPRQGFLEDNVFYHPVLRFQFPVPRNWKLQNTRTLVRMMSDREDAVILFSVSSARTPEQAARNFADESKTSVIGSYRDNVNGLSAHHLNWQLRSGQGFLRGMSYFIQKNTKIYVFHGFSPANRFNNYASRFQETMVQFRNFTDPAKLAVQPARIRVRSTGSAGSLRQALRAFGTPKDKLESMALLNGKHLNDRIPANTLIKIVEKKR